MLNSKSVVKTKNVLTEIKGSAIFLGPTMLLFTLLFLIPLVSEIFYSFTNWNGIDPTFKFIGLKNYLRTVKDATYWTSFWFTIKFSIFVVVISNLIGFFWAYVLSGDIPYKNFWRALIYAPRIIGGVVLGDSFSRMYLSSLVTGPALSGLPSSGLQLRNLLSGHW